MLSWWRPLAMGLLALLCSALAHAQELRVCLNQEMARNNTGRLSDELVALVQRAMPGLKLTQTPLPWPRCLAAAEQGEYDGVLVGSHSPDRAKSLAYPLRTDGSLDASKRMFNLGFVLVRRAGSAVSWDGERFTQLDGPIGVQRGYSVIELLKDKQVPYDDGNASVQAGLQKLALGRVSGLLVNPFNLGHDEVVLPRGERVEVAGPLILSKPYFLILSRAFQDANPGLARKLWAAVEQARQSAEFRRLYARQLDALQEGLALQP